VDIRHQSSCQRLEEECNRGGHRGNVSTKTAHKGKETSEKSNGTKNKRNQVEGEHESRQIVVLVSTNELLGDTVLGSKVTGRIERKCWNDSAAIRIVSCRWVRSTDGKEGPSGWVARTGNSTSRSLQEIEAVEGCAVDSASEDGKELEQDTSSDEDQRYNRKDWTFDTKLAAVHNYYIRSTYE
jgi:hypothetical protein